MERTTGRTKQGTQKRITLEKNVCESAARASIMLSQAAEEIGAHFDQVAYIEMSKLELIRTLIVHMGTFNVTVRQTTCFLRIVLMLNFSNEVCASITSDSAKSFWSRRQKLNRVPRNDYVRDAWNKHVRGQDPKESIQLFIQSFKNGNKENSRRA